MKLVVDGLLTNYLEDGPSGAPIVLLLHGWGADATNFDLLARGLAVKFRVIRLDLPGFGGTERPKSAWNIRDYAGFVQDFCAKLNISKLQAVAGHSFGGRVVLKGLAEGIIPSRQAILIDSAGLKPAGSWRRHAYVVVAKAGKAAVALPGLARLAPSLRRRLYQSAGSSDYLNSGEMRQIFLNAISEDQSSDASHISVPTLLIWGAEDTDTPPTDGRTLANLIPHASLTVVPGAGHFAHNDAPEAVLKLIVEFLA
jgi:pimeloyl-ACP methyl ester carboxylesterase